MWQAHLKKHWKVYAVIIVVLLNVATATSAFAFYRAWDNSQSELSAANNVIQAHVDEIQSFDAKLGVAESNLRRQKDLAKKYEDEIENLDGEFLDMVDKYKLEIKSRERTIAGLKGKVKGGNTTTTVVENTSEGSFETVVDVSEVCGGKTIAYDWEDGDKRFHLKDPDISKQGDETFDYHQFVAIKGFVFTDETGNVQVKKIEVSEVIPRTNEATGEVTYELVPDGKVTIADSKFEYTNKSAEEESWKWLDPITLRPVAVFDVVSLQPGVGLELVNLGRWVPYANIGLVPRVTFDATDVLGGSLQNSRVGIGAVYHFLPPLVNTNLALGVGVSTPFNNLGQWMLYIDLTFYLTDDLFPSSFKSF